MIRKSLLGLSQGVVVWAAMSLRQATQTEPKSLTVSSIRVRIRINSVVTVLRCMCVLTEGPSISETNMAHGIQTRRVIVATNEHSSIIQQKPAFDVRPCENVKDMLVTVDLQD